MTNEQKILNILASRIWGESTRNISNYVGFRMPATRSILYRLEQKGDVKSKLIGNQRVWFYNRNIDKMSKDI